MTNYWSWATRSAECSSDYYDWGATVSPPSVIPVLPIPTYATTTIWDGEHCVTEEIENMKTC